VTFAVDQMNLGGTTFVVTNGNLSPVFVPGNNKQWTGSNWVSIATPGKGRLRRFIINGRLEGQDGAKSDLEDLRDSGTYTYNDQVHNLTVVVISLGFSYAHGPSGGFQQWDVSLVLEEYDQA